MKYPPTVRKIVIKDFKLLIRLGLWNRLRLAWRLLWGPNFVIEASIVEIRDPDSIQQIIKGVLKGITSLSSSRSKTTQVRGGKK